MSVGRLLDGAMIAVALLSCSSITCLSLYLSTIKVKATPLFDFDARLRAIRQNLTDDLHRSRAA